MNFDGRGKCKYLHPAFNERGRLGDGGRRGGGSGGGGGGGGETI